MNIALTGFMGTGKTTTGKLLAKKLGWEFVDIDAIIERNAEMSVSDIFAHFGELNFRDRETQAIKQLSTLDKKVFSCGGGAVLRSENMDILEKTGMIVCLTASPEVIYQRVHHHTTRPLLKVSDPLKTIKELLATREPFYRRCTCTINSDTLSPEQIVEEILKLIKVDK
ncbi:MAG: shikimate kinase [Endomicrobiales bacterium]|jgi:shikimate kinase